MLFGPGPEAVLLRPSQEAFEELATRGNLVPVVRELLVDMDTPVSLFRKLDEWGFDSLVIPHGTSWGIYTPPLSSWDKQLKGAMHDPERQTLIEVYSGHGDSDVPREG